AALLRGDARRRDLRPARHAGVHGAQQRPPRSLGAAGLGGPARRRGRRPAV
ncbi:MAG: hypothetical protein AVDCRST_MAG35-413, partial [uncultured Quadrisphaera sp.]